MEGNVAPPSIDARERLQRQAAEKPGLISFAGGLPDPALFPKNQLSRAFVAALSSQPAAALQYGWPEGSLELRQQIASQLEQRGIEAEPERIIVTSGAQQAIQIAVSVVGNRPRVGVEPESYPGALEIFRNARGKLVGLEDKADLYYVMPSVSNPRGQSMAIGARRDLLERARRGRAYVIEDDAYAGTHFSGKAEPALAASAPGRVFHVGTFSKTLCPGLRIGWLVPPRKLARAALKHKQATDLQASGLSQALLADYLKTRHFEALQRRARAHYRRKLQRLLDAVKRQLPELKATVPIGGFSLWLESELTLDDARLLEAAIEQGVSFDPGQPFQLRPQSTLAFRLCFSAVPAADIELGVARLARALKRLAD
jgi:2-aminoadipate transaminase